MRNDNLRHRKGHGAAPTGGSDDSASPRAATAAAAVKADGAAATAADAGWLERYERFVPWVIFAISLATRFYRLDKPPG
jgi:hypothetical protein